MIDIGKVVDSVVRQNMMRIDAGNVRHIRNELTKYGSTFIDKYPEADEELVRKHVAQILDAKIDGKEVGVTDAEMLFYLDMVNKKLALHRVEKEVFDALRSNFFDDLSEEAKEYYKSMRFGHGPFRYRPIKRAG